MFFRVETSCSLVADTDISERTYVFHIMIYTGRDKMRLNAYNMGYCLIFCDNSIIHFHICFSFSFQTYFVILSQNICCLIFENCKAQFVDGECL